MEQEKSWIMKQTDFPRVQTVKLHHGQRVGKNLEKQEVPNGTCDISASENVPVLLLFHHGKRFVWQLNSKRGGQQKSVFFQCLL